MFRKIAFLCVLISLPTLAKSGPESNSRFHKACHTSWPFTDNPSLELSRKCVSHWLMYMYGENWNEEDLTLDPFGCKNPNLQIRIEDAQRMIDHLEKVCKSKDEGDWPCKRAKEGLGLLRDDRIGFHDSYGEIRVSFKPLLETVLLGKPLTRKMLDNGMGGWADTTLRKVRNAVFARHGRLFKSKDLQEFFYGPEWPDRWSGFPAKPKLQHSGYKDSLLTETDKANIKLLKEVEKRKK
jgi:YARHG domain-containing protein